MNASKENCEMAMQYVRELEKPITPEHEEVILAFLYDFLTRCKSRLPTESTIQKNKMTPRKKRR